MPSVVHVIQKLAVGGLENGLVNLINHMPGGRYRHILVCLTNATEFGSRITSQGVRVIELNQPSASTSSVYLPVFRLLRELKPNIVHTRNLAALEFQAIAALAGVRCRVHGEHGRDMYDLDGRNFKYNLLRKLMRLFVHRYIAVSRNLSDWLVDTVSVRAERVAQIYNGVDSQKFRPRSAAPGGLLPRNFEFPGRFVVGTVGRLEPVKDQLTLVRAFIYLLRQKTELRDRLRLVIVGDGSLRAQALQLLREAGAEELAWLPGERDDVADIMPELDLFVLPSLREGISNTILEAMASGLAVVATDVGGNPELVRAGETGSLVAPSDPAAIANAIRFYLENPDKVQEHGAAGRRRVESQFSMAAMVDGYLSVYDALLNGDKRPVPADLAHPCSPV